MRYNISNVQRGKADMLPPVDVQTIIQSRLLATSLPVSGTLPRPYKWSCTGWSDRKQQRKPRKWRTRWQQLQQRQQQFRRLSSCTHPRRALRRRWRATSKRSPPSTASNLRRGSQDAEEGRTLIAVRGRGSSRSVATCARHERRVSRIRLHRGLAELAYMRTGDVLQRAWFRQPQRREDACGGRRGVQHWRRGFP